eukprot:12912825-Prorocentrum_lima.AAC.1
MTRLLFGVVVLLKVADALVKPAHVAVVGGGWGGWGAAKALVEAGVKVKPPSCRGLSVQFDTIAKSKKKKVAEPDVPVCMLQVTLLDALPDPTGSTPYLTPTGGRVDQGRSWHAIV